MHPAFAIPLLALALAGPARAQDEAAACADEVRRLSDAFAIEGGDGGEARAAIAGQPGARKGASLTAEERRRLGDLVAGARRDAEQGEGQDCLRQLGEARALLREAGLGGGQPGTADTGGTTVGPIGGPGDRTTGAGSGTTLPRGTGAAGAAGARTSGEGTSGTAGGGSGSGGGGS